MAAGSERAFLDQRFGSFAWPERYPNQSEPFINIAGAVSDFARGMSRPLSRRFDRRPALSDTGTLANSITSQLVGLDSVEVGTTVEYASIHQSGGVSIMKIDQATKKRMNKWLFTVEGEPYRGKMLILVQPNSTQLDTVVAQRPFVGITDEIETDLVAMIEEEFSA